MGVTVQVKTLTGKQIPIQVEQTDSVESLKQQICNSTEIPTEQQRLIVGGKQMQNGKTLNDYDVVENTTVMLALELR